MSVAASSFWPFLSKRGPVIVLAAVLACLLAYLWPRAQSFAGGSDPSGYLHNAKLLLDGRLEVPYRPIGELPYETFEPQVYTPLGFRLDADSGMMRPTYPFGLPLVIAALGSVFGLEMGAQLTIVGSCWLAILGMFALAREVTKSDWWAVGCTAALAASPVFVFMSVALMSDVLSTALACWCFWGALRIKDRWSGAVALGGAFSLLVLARLPNVLLALPIAMVLGGALRRRRVSMGVVAGGLPGAAFLGTTNALLYGSAFASGYQGLGREFGWTNVPESLSMYAEWGTRTLSPILVAGFLCSIVLLPRRPRLVGALWSWAFLFFAFYAFYMHTATVWWYLRFTLPAFPAIILGAALFTQWALSPREGWSWTRALPYGGVAVFGAALWLEAKWLDPLVSFGLKAEDPYVLFTEWVAEELPEDAIIACMQFSGHSLYTFDNPILRFDWLRPQTWETATRETARLGISVYAPLFPFEIDDLKALERMPGDWELVADRSSCSIYRLRQ